jgi:uncharacterized membrane protein YbhN (UPF0104 family)
MKPPVINKPKRPITFTRIGLLIILLLGIYYFLPQVGKFSKTFGVIEHASLFWLLVGFIIAGLSFYAAALTQYAAGNYIGKFKELVLLQFAGSFINHFLPFNFAGVNYTSKYYVKHGSSRAKSLVMSTIPVAFGIITSVALVAVISPLTLVHYLNKLHNIHLKTWQVAVIIAVIIILVAVGYIYHKIVKVFVKELWSGMKSVQNINQISVLLLGSLLITFTSTGVLWVSILAIHHTANIVAIFALYVTSSVISNVAPTPGGIGAIEAVLVIGLVALRFNLSDAAAITLIYRFFTFWLPILPGGIALHFVNKNKVV